MMWIIIAIGLLALGAVVAVRSRHAASQSDLGWVTERWLAEHRNHIRGESR